MARIDRIVARRTGATRTVSKRQKQRRVYDAPRGTPFRQHKGWRYERLPYHAAGSSWWRERFADLVERRINTRTKDGAK